jgi:hypothetical protein
MLSPKIAGKLEVSATVVKLVPIATVILVGSVFGLINGNTAEAFTSSVGEGSGDFGSVFAGIAAAAFAYEGWIVATSINSELKNPKKDLPRALVIGTVIIMAVYILFFIGLTGGATVETLMKEGATRAIRNLFGNVGGTMVSMETGETQTHLEFSIPTRGIMGLKTRIMNVTHGEGVFYHTFLEYGPFAGDIGGRKNGAMISMSTEKAVAYALGTLQERGALFVGPGEECYEGMLVGERPRPDDMVVNIARTKNLGNQRSSTADIAVQLTPPRTFTLEEALEYIMDDELVEITPKHIRMRKRLLTETERRKWNVRHGLVNK